MSAPPFARLVTEAMARRGLGLRELCRRARLDPSFLSKVLAGKRNPPAEDEVLRRIADALEADAVALFVAAGRVPDEWRALAGDPELLRRVSLLAGHSPARRVPAAAAAPAPRAAAVRPAKPFNEELL
ncbi:MAG: helix-turn-helix domain-containing protein [Elusimicrobiota bacterium]|nr:MAG: helix-turn-helix domain-containing protein [Elusimicrobiota bacterium]